MGEDMSALSARIETAHGEHRHADEYELRTRQLKLPGIEPPERIELMVAAAVAADLSGHKDDAMSLVQGALELSITHDHLPGRIEALSELGVQLRYRGELERSKSLLSEGLEYADQLGEKRLIARCTANLAVTCRRLGEPDLAYDHGQQAARLYRDLGNLTGANSMLHLMAGIQRSQGMLEEARESLTEVIELDALTGDTLGRARSLGNLALLLMDMGRTAEATDRLQDAIELFRQMDAPEDVAKGLVNLAAALSVAGDMQATMRTLAEAESVARACGATQQLAVAELTKASSLWMLGRGIEARKLASDVLDRLGERAPKDMRQSGLLTLARVAMDEQDFVLAASLIEQAVPLTAPTATVLRLKAEVLRKLADTDAGEFALQSIELLDSVGINRTVEYLKCMVLAAELERLAGRSAEAGFLLEGAEELRDELELQATHPDPELRRALTVISELLSE